MVYESRSQQMQKGDCLDFLELQREPFGALCFRLRGVYTAVLGIKQTFTYPTVCLRVRSCCLTQRYQSKSLNEISLNPLGVRDCQSTLRFEQSISAV